MRRSFSNSELQFDPHRFKGTAAIQAIRQAIAQVFVLQHVLASLPIHQMQPHV